MSKIIKNLTDHFFNAQIVVRGKRNSRYVSVVISAHMHKVYILIENYALHRRKFSGCSGKIIFSEKRPEIDVQCHFGMQNGDFRFVKNYPISYNMGIFVTGMTCYKQKSISDALLKSKMATSGL